MLIYLCRILILFTHLIPFNSGMASFWVDSWAKNTQSMRESFLPRWSSIMLELKTYLSDSLSVCQLTIWSCKPVDSARLKRTRFPLSCNRSSWCWINFSHKEFLRMRKPLSSPLCRSINASNLLGSFCKALGTTSLQIFCPAAKLYLAAQMLALIPNLGLNVLMKMSTLNFVGVGFLRLTFLWVVNWHH